MHTIKRNLNIFALLLFSHTVFAGGPLVLEGKNGNTPVKYQNANVTIHVETGPLGALTNSDATTLMQEALSLWNDVDTATINISVNTTTITDDIDADNFEDFIPDVSGTEFNSEDGLNPIAYDNNGEIIDAFFGPGQSDFTIGFAASIFNLEGSFFLEGYAVINGKDLGLTDTEFKLLIAHEMGHFIGIDHTQANISTQETDFGSPIVCTTASQDQYPIMYPFVCRSEETLHADDISSVSALYPTANIEDSFGIIEGRFVDEGGDAILGANIWAKSTTTGEVVSITTDYLTEGNGFYKLYLKPGNYTLHVNSINRLFNGGSSIGPYASSLAGKSFQAPHPLTEIALTENGNDEVITVSANKTLTINLSSTGNSVILKSESGGGGSFALLLSMLLLSLIAVSRHISKNIATR